MIVAASQSQQLQVQQRDAVDQVDQLEAAIKIYKSEYAGAIRDTEIIRSEMELVTRKVLIMRQISLNIAILIVFMTMFAIGWSSRGFVVLFEPRNGSLEGYLELV